MKMHRILRAVRNFGRSLNKHSESISLAVLGVTSSGVFVGSLWPTKFFRQYYGYHKNGEEVPLSQKSLDLTQEVLDKIDMDFSSEALLNFFKINSFEPYHRGSCRYNTGCIIGLPHTFDCETVLDVDAYINDVPVDMSTTAGQRAAESAMLSDDAKKFVIAREVFYTNGHHPAARMLLVGVFAYATFITNGYLYAVRDLRRKSRSFRWTAFNVVLLGFVLLGVTVNNFLESRRDRRVDRKAAELGKEFALGGVEFYTKDLQRHLALRELMGAEGEHIYTPAGNRWRSMLDFRPTDTERRRAMLEAFRKHEELEQKLAQERQEEEERIQDPH